MKRLPGRSVCGLVLLLAVGCGSGGGNSKSVALKAGGSSFVFPAMTKWDYEYKLGRKVEVTYLSVGSKAGIQGMTDRTFDFGCTDAPLNEEELTKARAVGGDVVHIPLALGAVVPSYNLPDVEAELTFTGPVLADIYLGKIKKWNDKAIQEINPGIALPNQDITVVHRLDGSGTTYIWADYLAKTSPEWKKNVGVSTALKWPCGLAERGNEGVERKVHDTPGAIGYIELTYVLQSGLQFGMVKNREGNPIKASRWNVTAAADNALTDIPDDLRFSITDPPGKNSYPICGASWAILYVNQPADKGREIVDFLRWVTHEGQPMIDQLHYSKLPDGLVQRLEKKLDEIKVGQ